MKGIELDDVLYWYLGTVHRVYDGDTFTQVTTRLGLKSVHEKERFRLWGIQANEIRGTSRTEEYKERAEKAKKRLRELTYGDVLLRTFKSSKSNELDKYGKYGRWLCIVFVPFDRVKELGTSMDYATLLESLLELEMEGRKVVRDIGGYKFVDVNLLLVAEGLADIKYY